MLIKIFTSSPRIFCAVTFFLSLRSGLSGRRRSVSFNKLVPNILWEKSFQVILNIDSLPTG